MPANIASGQIWREVDPRSERYVRVERVSAAIITLQCVEFDGTLWRAKKGSRRTEAQRQRFNGKRGGYDLYSESP